MDGFSQNWELAMSANEIGYFPSVGISLDKGTVIKDITFVMDIYFIHKIIIWIL